MEGNKAMQACVATAPARAKLVVRVTSGLIYPHKIREWGWNKQWRPAAQPNKFISNWLAAFHRFQLCVIGADSIFVRLHSE